MRLIDFFLFAGIAQSLTLSVVLFSLKGNRRANVFLGLLVLCIGMSLFINHNSIVTEQSLPLPRALLPAVIFLFGPLLFWYVRVSLSGYGFRAGSLLHGVPFLAGAAVSALAFFNPASGFLAIAGQLFSVVKIIHVLVYVIGLLVILRRYGRTIRTRFADIERISFHWLSFLLSAFLAGFVIIAGTGTLFYLFGDAGFLAAGETVTVIIILVFIFIMSFLAIRQPAIFAAVKKEAAGKYARSTLKKDESERLYARLLDVMKRGKPHLESDLSIGRLARRTGIPDYHLSQIINENTGSSFFDFINRHRISEVVRLLADEHPAGTILEIAYRAGYNTKSAFNKAFKKEMHLTPSAYKKTIAR